jgi:hypothetical protein
VSELCGSAALPQLFAALQRGEDEGQDNDGLVAALIELAAADRAAARLALEELPRQLILARARTPSGCSNSVLSNDHLRLRGAGRESVSRDFLSFALAPPVRSGRGGGL